MEPRITAVVFDLGGVLIDWNPRYLYRTLFDDEAAMEEFLATVTTQEWNEPRTRAGRGPMRSRSSPSAIPDSAT
jgi:2-haloacid dehalogenase